MRQLPWLWTLTVVVGPAVAQAPDYKGLAYTTPPGWSSGERDGQLVLAPGDMTDQTAVVVILLGAERLRGAPFQDWFQGRLAQDAAGAKVLRDSPVQSGTSGSLQVLSTGRTIQDASGGVRLQIVYAIADATQAGAAMVLTASEAALTKHLPAVQQLFRTLRFSAPAAAADPPIAATPAPSPTAAGAPATFHNVLYTVPTGWAARENAGGVALSPRGALQGDETLDVVILPGKLATSLEEEFAITWQEVVAMLNAESMRNVSGAAYDLEEVGRSASGWDFLRGSGGARNAQQRFTVSLFLAKVNERIERVAIISREIRVNLTTAHAAGNPRFAGAIDEFLFGLRFANWTTPAFPEARLTGGAITGAWRGISMFGGRLATGAVVFFSDGSAWFGGNFPTYGLEGVKPHIASRADRRRWGRYQFENGAGTLTMPSGAIPLRIDGEALVLTTNRTPHRFIRSHPSASGRLDGHYCLTTGAGCLILTAGGRFRDEGAIRVVEHAVYPYPVSPERGQGTYQIRDYTLVLRYESGPEVRVAFPGFVDRAAAQSPSPEEIILSFNGDTLRRR
ncbi:MAG: hypothetical protein ACKVZ0_22380 [Gemmatimonadales bacterium]